MCFEKPLEILKSLLTNFIVQLYPAFDIGQGNPILFEPNCIQSLNSKDNGSHKTKLHVSFTEIMCGLGEGKGEKEIW